MAQSSSAVYPPDDEEVDYSLFSFDRPQPDLAFELDAEYQAHLKNPPIQHARTRRLREQLAPDISCHKVLAVLSYMDNLGLNLPLFLDLLSWGDKGCTENMKINYERTALMVSEELPSILKRWYRPPRSPGSTATRPAGASSTLERFSFDCVAEVVEQELEGVEDIMRCSADELSTESLTSLQIDELLLQLSSPGLGGTPKFWSLLQRLAVPKRQSVRHIVKSPDLVSWTR